MRRKLRILILFTYTLAPIFCACSSSREIENADNNERRRISETEIFILDKPEEYDTSGARESIISDIQKIFPADYLQEADTNYVYIVQLGAFARIQKAEELVNIIPEKYSDNKKVVFDKRNQLYLVQLGPFADKGSGQKIMDQLISDKVVSEAILLKREK